MITLINTTFIQPTELSDVNRGWEYHYVDGCWILI